MRGSKGKSEEERESDGEGGRERDSKMDGQIESYQICHIIYK